ncbi:MAG TPA: hypothetical protein EYN66_02605 [Myxococcales bacterium]|nr:hypothetical protein [Myxococcales bacterium]
MRAHAQRCLLTVVCTLILCTSAYGGMEERLGLGSRATALGGAFSAIADDFSAAYYNPAGPALKLTPENQTGISMHFGMVWARSELSINLGQVSGNQLRFDTPISSNEASAVDHSIDPVMGFTLGIGFDLERLFKIPRLKIGLALFLPARRFFRWDVQGGHAIQWPMYTDRNQSLSAMPWVAVRLHKRVSLGVGARVGVSVKTNTEAVILPTEAPTDTPKTELGNDVRIAGRIAPTVGLLIQACSQLRIGLTWRGEIYTNDFGYTDVDASNLSGASLGTFGYTHHLAHYFSPMTATLGLAYTPLSEFTISSDLSWNRWSTYLDSNHDNYGGKITDDTLTPRVGIQWRFHPSTQLLGGYFYEFSPFDNQGGWTNFVDPDRHVASIGTQTNLATLLGNGRRAINLSWHLQMEFLRKQREIKDWHRFESEKEARANPGWPGWQAQGWGLNVGLSVDTEF